jgi:hypothetical protein
MTEQQQYPTREQIAEAIRNSDWDALGNWDAEPERIKEDYRKNADAVLALFPQPTPSAEQSAEYDRVAAVYGAIDDLVVDQGADVAAEGVWAIRDALDALIGWDQEVCAAAKPSIADMAPGTTFTATTCDGHLALWVTLSDGNVMTGNGAVRDALDIDPSTIRDVSPPKDAA